MRDDDADTDETEDARGDAEFLAVVTYARVGAKIDRDARGAGCQ